MPRKAIKLKPQEDKSVRLNISGDDGSIEGFDNADKKALLKRWPYADNSVDEVRSINYIHLLTPDERVHFLNELWRVLKVNTDQPTAQGAPEHTKALIITPHPGHLQFAYRDYRAKFPLITEESYFFFNRKWREDNKFNRPEIKANFRIICGLPINERGLHQTYHGRNMEYVQDAIAHNVNVVSEIWANLFKLPKDAKEF